MRSSEFIIRSNFASYEPKKYPIYRKTMNYNIWLNVLTSDLIRRLNQQTQDSGTFIFLKYLQLGKCSEEVIFFETILPYVLVQVILYGSDSLLKDWETELDVVFKVNLTSLNKHQIENIKNVYENIFNVVDYVKKMISEISAKSSKTDREISLLEKLNNYVNKISFGDVLANKSLEIASYERSILYLEQAYREDEKKLCNEYKDKLNIAFSNIQDFDALEGVEQFFISGNSLDEKLDSLANSTTNWMLAKECYEELQSNWGNVDMKTNTKAIQVLAKNQIFDQIIAKVDTILLPDSKFRTENNSEHKLLEYGLESTAIVNDSFAATKLIDETERNFKFLQPGLLLNYSLNKIMFNKDYNSNNDANNDFVKLGIATISQRYISNVKTMTILKVKDIINKLYLFGDASICIDYNNNYQSLKKDALKGKSGYEGLDFESLFKIEAVSVNLDRKFVNLDENESFNRFFHIAQEARKNHRPDIGMKYLMKSFNLEKNITTERFELEYAEMLWEAGERENAINTIKGCSMDIMNGFSINNSEAKLQTLSKYTQWCDALNRKSPTEIIDQYLKLLELCDNNEALSFELGLYYDKYYQQRQKTIIKRSVDDVRIDFELITNSIKYLLISLSETSSEHHVKEALPKVVILWLDTIEKINGKIKYAYVAKDINKLIQNATKTCTSKIWYTVMLQLISRLLVPSHEARSLITKILSELFKAYPHYIIWHVTVMGNSKNEFIKDAGNKIISGFLKKTTKANKLLIQKAILLNENLSKICNEDAKKTATTIDEDFDFTNRNSIFPSEIAVPVQLNFGVTLPDPNLVRQSLVTIQDISPNYTVFNSLKKPKKITMLGSNGKNYDILCKKEDVRQDDQYMQFAQTMKYVLNNNKDSFKRNMDITTYYIMPLDESFGIIELVPNVVTIRSILSNLYDNRSLYNDRITYMRHWNKFKNNDAQLKLLFEKNLKIFKPILFEWFLSIFPDPAKWYHCKTNFARSYGVMCMVGHILGLGDRHFDNILISEKNGVVLHVDYDCLFEKGVDLPTPELVPFRLTNNIVDCLGITGVEGIFRKSCELSMNLIRENEMMLLNEFEMMMYGRMKSLEDQKKKKEGSRELRYLFIGRSGLSPEQILGVIRNKMRGIDPKDSVTISVAAQVENLLKEAQDKNLLYRMYSGWMPIW
ncbi:kinase-like protein [Hanseniaspora valbyensis NRRL Y-1626]|uniref:non-specific serine/threonine protein kinase n=1 Tax=Hanseniaspora valbyensis NRRL Y-1626 TaxID=766949 RepID=A0A1B7T9H0_9ASCO|nr:kinase-like protein [Hanseniaspora valbyensis NRRL Y-1626]